jgi:hypothetical protein
VRIRVEVLFPSWYLGRTLEDVTTHRVVVETMQILGRLRQSLVADGSAVLAIPER